MNIVYQCFVSSFVVSIDTSTKARLSRVKPDLLIQSTWLGVSTLLNYMVTSTRDYQHPIVDESILIRWMVTHYHSRGPQI